MSRSTEFDPQQVIHQALERFWTQGYATTSIQDLVAATDVRPGSLYHAFGNKEELFLSALEHYYQRLLADLEGLFHAAHSPLSGVRAFFDGLADQQNHDTAAKGCLLINTLAERRARDERIDRRVNVMFAHIEQRLTEQLRAAQRVGELDATRDPETLARSLLAGIYGLRLDQRRHTPPTDYRPMVDTLLRMLD